MQVYIGRNAIDVQLHYNPFITRAMHIENNPSTCNTWLSLANCRSITEILQVPLYFKHFYDPLTRNNSDLA